MEWNVFLSKDDEISPATVKSTNGEGENLVGGRFREQKEDYSVFTVSFKLELRRVREECVDGCGCE